MRKSQLSSRFVIMSIIILLLSSCDSSKKDWERAEKANTIESYEQFLEKHPENQVRGLALQKIEQLEWERACKIGTLESYRDFCEKYPDSTRITHAFQKLEEIVHLREKQGNPKMAGKLYSTWENIKNSNNLFAYIDYVALNSNSPYTALANIKIAQLLKIKNIEVFLKKNEEENLKDQDEFFTEVKKYDKDINRDKINNYINSTFQSVLSKMGIYDPASSENLKLTISIIPSFGNWWTSKVYTHTSGSETSYEYHDLSKGIYINSKMEIMTPSGIRIKSYSFSDGWVIFSANQWECIKKSIDMHIGLFLKELAKENIRTIKIIKDLIDNDYLPHDIHISAKEHGIFNSGLYQSNNIWEVLGEIPHTYSIKTLRSALSNSNDQVKVASARSLAQLGYKQEVLGTLKTCLGSNDEDAKRDAQKVLHEIQSNK